MKENIGLEALEMISGGTGEDWAEIARRMYDNTDHELESEHHITDRPEWDNPHSKKKKGTLYK